MAQAEMLYVNLISVSYCIMPGACVLIYLQLAQWHGIFTANGDVRISEILDSTTDEEKRWYAWSKIECVKR